MAVDAPSIAAVAAVKLRAEREGEAAAIHALLQACFPTSTEADLVTALRASGRLALSWVAGADEGIVGHIGFSPVRTTAGQKGLGLAPLGVAPKQRRQGIGSQLVRAGLAAAQEAGCRWVVVLGDPGYYSRFGFQPARACGLSDAYGSGEAFQLLVLEPGGLPAGGGRVHYAPEFAQFS